MRSQPGLWYTPPMSDLVPKEPEFNDKVLEYSDQLSEFMSDQALVATKINRVPRRGSQRERFLTAMAEAFEIVGGVPRLALWADKNYTEFAKILGKQIPGLVQNAISVKTNGPVTIVSAIPPSFLDGESVDSPEKVVDEQ